MTIVMFIYVSTIKLGRKDKMLLPCEVVEKSLIPAIRSIVARELIQSYGLKQREGAYLLGVTQTAVSKYIRHVRGTVLKNENIKEI